MVCDVYSHVNYFLIITVLENPVLNSERNQETRFFPRDVVLIRLSTVIVSSVARLQHRIYRRRRFTGFEKRLSLLNNNGLVFILHLFYSIWLWHNSKSNIKHIWINLNKNNKDNDDTYWLLVIVYETRTHESSSKILLSKRWGGVQSQPSRSICWKFVFSEIFQLLFQIRFGKHSSSMRFTICSASKIQAGDALISW